MIAEKKAKSRSRRDFLRAWPWEYAYLDRAGTDKASMEGFLALDPRISFVRHDPLPQAHAKIQSAGEGLQRVRMLAATAQPAGSFPLNLEREVNLLRQALANFSIDGVSLEINPLLAHATPGLLETNLSIGAARACANEMLATRALHETCSKNGTSGDFR